jgi:glycosyltransferase involved in cell wall biosynthesis
MDASPAGLAGSMADGAGTARDGSPSRPIRSLFLTNNGNLGSTARILQCWLALGESAGVRGIVAMQRRGPFTDWLAGQRIPVKVDPMPWPSKTWPVPSLLHAARLGWWARKNEVDVIHCNEHDVYPFGLLLRGMLRKPLVVHIRFGVTREFCRWAFGRRGCRPDALFWTSQQQWDDCAEAVDPVVPRDRQHLIPLGIDLGSFGNQPAVRDDLRRSLGFPPDAVVIGTASALRPRKRIEDFVEVVARLARQDARVFGLIAGDAVPGDEPYRDKILGMIEDLGLGSRIRCMGHLDDVEPFYHAIDVFVSTSEYETFGNSVCEAMACRRPIAAYRGGSVHEVVGDAGLVVETGDLSALVEAVERLVGDAELRREFGDEARDRVARVFDPRATIKRVGDIYRTLLGTGVRHRGVLDSPGPSPQSAEEPSAARGATPLDHGDSRGS